MSESASPRVLFITRNLPPLRGGMERLCRHMAVELAGEFDVTVVGPRGAREYLSPEVRFEAVSAAPLWKFFVSTLWRGVRAARRLRPDVVLGGSGLVAPFVWLAAKLSGARCALYVHGLDLIPVHPIYRVCWLPVIRRADLCFANSRYTAQLAQSSGVAAERISVVHPGVDLPEPQAMHLPNDFRTRFDLGDRPLLLSVGRLITRKGLFEFVDRALPEIARAVPDVCLVVLGDEAPELLHGSSMGLGDRIRGRAAELGLAEQIHFIGPQSDATLADAWSAADVHIFPVREDPNDVEGFGMVAVEAASHGLPTVAFAVGGVPDAVEEGVSGYLVKSGEYGQFASKVIEVLREHGETRLRISSREFAQDFVWENFGAALRGKMRVLAGAEK